jgi:hypothetical protein
MTVTELAVLPVGSTVVFEDNEIGTIVKAGREVWIEWSDCTSIIYTQFESWNEFLCFVEA